MVKTVRLFVLFIEGQRQWAQHSIFAMPINLIDCLDFASSVQLCFGRTTAINSLSICATNGMKGSNEPRVHSQRRIESNQSKCNVIKSEAQSKRTESSVPVPFRSPRRGAMILGAAEWIEHLTETRFDSILCSRLPTRRVFSVY